MLDVILLLCVNLPEDCLVLVDDAARLTGDLPVLRLLSAALDKSTHTEINAIFSTRLLPFPYFYRQLYCRLNNYICIINMHFCTRHSKSSMNIFPCIYSCICLFANTALLCQRLYRLLDRASTSTFPNARAVGRERER